MTRPQAMYASRRSRLLLGASVGAVAALLMLAGPASAAGASDWTPQASERLVKLPSAYLKRSIERDYAGSGLAAAIREKTDAVGLKQQSVKDLMASAQRTEGELALELRHQGLAGKQQLVRLMGERLDLKRDAWRTRAELYRDLLEQVRRSGAAASPEQEALAQDRAAAQARLAESSVEVDTTLFGTGAEQSRYTQKYAEIQTAKRQLLARINSHPMNTAPMLDGESVDRETYLRRLVEDAEAMVAILDEEEELLGFMGKLVALDAMALSEEVAAANAPPGGLDPEESEGVAGAVDLFLQ